MAETCGEARTTRDVRNNMQRSSYRYHYPNGYNKDATSLVIQSVSASEIEASVDLYIPQAWVGSHSPTRSCNYAAKVQQALLCDNANFLCQCR